MFISKYLVFPLVLFINFLFAQGENGKVQELEYAKNFEITHFSTHCIAKVHICDDELADEYVYALVSQEALLPKLPEDVRIIRTPIEDVVILETIYIGFLDAIDQLNSIVGAATTDYISHPLFRKRIADGLVQNIQTAKTLNIERLLMLRPKAVFTSIPNGAALGFSDQLSRAGLPVILTAAYRERHPLARAEWIKFIAAFFEATTEADQIFNAIVNRYEALLEIVDTCEKRPNVFCGAPYSGIWHVAGGDSYMAQLIEDAGGNYLWSDVSGTKSVPLDFERVFSKAANAEIWLNPSFYRSFDSLFASEYRFKKFRSAQTGKIYNNTKQQDANIGNPIWETGILSPDDILADLIQILHSDKLTDHDFVYYEQLR